MRLFDFVKQHDAVRFPPHRLAELSTLFVPDVARRRTDQPGDGVFLHVFAHVEPNHCVFVVEKEFSQRAAQFSFPHSSWAEENKRTYRSILILYAGSGMADSVRDRADRLALFHHPLTE